MQAPPGPTRAEVTQIADIFRARVVDVSERTLTFSVTGDQGKARAYAPAPPCFLVSGWGVRVEGSEQCALAVQAIHCLPLRHPVRPGLKPTAFVLVPAPTHTGVQMAAFQKVLAKFGIAELVRTGPIALKRGENFFEWDER